MAYRCPCVGTPHSYHSFMFTSLIVVGAGLIGPRHCEHIYQRSDCKLVAVVDHSAKGPEIAARFNTLLFKSVDDYFEYVEQNNLVYVDGAIVATPNHTHLDLGVKLASKHIHLLIEKPLSSNAQDCRFLTDYCNERHVQLLIGHHRRFNPYIIQTKNNLSKIGRPIAVQGSWCIKKNYSYYLEKNWRISKDNGGGTILINLVHDLDLLIYLLGPITKIYADLLEKQRNFEVDEGCVLTLTFANGCKGVFIVGDNIISPFNFELGTGENPNVPKFTDLSGFYRIFGSNGTLSVPDLKLYHQNSLKDGSWLEPVEVTNLAVHNQEMDEDMMIDFGIKTPVQSPMDTINLSVKPFDLQLEHFINLIHGVETKSKCGGDDALLTLLCIETVMKSVESGKPELVPLA